MTITLQGEPFIAYVLAAIRVLAWIMLVPPFSFKAVPAMAKSLLAFGLALAMAPTLTMTEIPTDAWTLGSYAVQEALIGATLGFVTYMIFAAVQAAGDLIDVFGGFSLAMGFDPLSFNQNAAFGKLYQMLALMLLFATDAHLLLVGGLLKTFERMPVGTLWQVADIGQVLVQAFTVFFVSAVQIALPMIGVLFITDLGLALLTKVAPQLNAIMVMFPAKIMLTLFLIGLSLPVLPNAIERLLEAVSDAVGAIG
ncbi:flagellar biosynthetic protein FliR [Nocardioides pakistanensis]